MSGISNAIESALINAYFKNSSLARPANFYVALFTSDPAEDASGTEVSGGSYARVAVPTGASSEWANESGGTTSNSGTVTFPTATADWGTITHVALFDASSGGTMWLYGTLSASRVVANGGIFRFNPNQLTVSFL